MIMFKLVQVLTNYSQFTICPTFYLPTKAPSSTSTTYVLSIHVLFSLIEGLFDASEKQQCFIDFFLFIIYIYVSFSHSFCWSETQ